MKIPSGCPLHRMILIVFAIFLGGQPAMGWAQDDDEESDFFPGLVGRFRSGGHEVSRVDEILSFDWGSSAPDSRLPRGPFRAEWTGELLARSSGQHVFHTFLAGSVEIKIDDEVVLTDSQQLGFTSGQPFQLTAGEHRIEVSYSTSKESDKQRARLNVFWSSDSFTLEPIPADVLFREKRRSQLLAQADGHAFMDSHRCAACHQQEGGMSILHAPDLNRISGSQTDQVLIQRLMNPSSVVKNSHMPTFGFNKQQAENLAAFLKSLSKNEYEDSPQRPNAKDNAAGTKLLNSLGCVACHQLPGVKQNDLLSDPYDAPELVGVGVRRSAEWLARWLKDPASLNPDHRMPVFDLTKDERRQLVAALTSNATPGDSKAVVLEVTDQAIAAGRQLVIDANCAACHQISGIKARAVAGLNQDSLSGQSQSCVRGGSGVPASQNQMLAPFFDVAEPERFAVTEWLRSDKEHSELNIYDQGKIELQRNGCVACHDRNAGRGLSKIAAKLQKTHPGLNGQSQGLVPPSLTAVGDKLNDDYLQTAIAGAQKERRLPWLLVRMPKFKHTEQTKTSLLHYLKTSDRIPDAADEARQDILADLPDNHRANATPEELLLGNQLTGAGGFNCVACHKAGAFEPRNVALGTRGSDIMTMGERLRPRFFQRWMKNPIRVVAGIEMPAIKKAMPGVLDDSLNKQVGVIWKALSDKRFTPPTVTTRFEQVVNVERGGTPRIIRDVFTVGAGNKQEAVARAMAIGFGNGHNILIDLDKMQVRLWTIGEFARQRTEGKSWYWDMPGISVQQSSEVENAANLIVDGEVLVPIEDEGRFAELISYQLDGDAVEVTCAWRFVDPKESQPKHSAEPHFSPTVWERTAQLSHRVLVRHRFQPTVLSDVPAGDGWKHSISVLEAPKGAELTQWLSIYQDEPPAQPGILPVRTSPQRQARVEFGQSAEVSLSVAQTVPAIKPPGRIPVAVSTSDSVTSTPGFTGSRLPIDRSIMPTSMAWLPDGRLAFTSLKGQVWIAADTDNDGLPDSTSLFEEGLAAPFGILADGDALIVAHKPEILRLIDSDNDGRADRRENVASGWGYNDNYHDWTSGLVRDAEGNLYVGLGSDYSQKQRPVNQDRWRGGVIRIDPSGTVIPLGMSMRYPMSLAIDNKGNLFATDNQGVQNTFNEINHILPNKHYGVPSIHQPTDNIQHEPPAVMVPHPWTRSVNSILFLPDNYPVQELRGHGIGCEYDSRFLMRFTIQDVGGTLQGASYRFSLPNQEAGKSNFIGPICSAVSPTGEIYIGSIWDSGWQGGRNTGGISKLVPNEKGLPNGIQEVKATKSGFEVQFFQPVDSKIATDFDSWSIQGYTREWGGSYGTPDSHRYTLRPKSISISEGGTKVSISVDDIRPGYVYDLSTSGPFTKSTTLWPAEAHYSMKVVPK